MQAFGVDYRDVPLPDDTLIYCDIPYNGTNCGKYGGFNHAEFYEWAKTKDNIYISEYSMPAEDFIQVARVKKRQLSTANGATDLIDERIYTNRKTYNKLSKQERLMAEISQAEQMTLFE